MAHRAVAVVGVLVLAMVAGCTQEAEPSSEHRPRPGPAEAYLEAALGVSADDAAQAARRMEESVAACMSEQGFEYVPDTSMYHSSDLGAVDPPPGTREFAEQFGYGFAALPEGMRVESTAGSNPNDEIVGAMSPEELAAYERALWGFTADDATAEDEVELGGCFGAARNEVWGDRDEDHVRVALEEEIERIDAEAAPMDPAVVEAAAEWSGCMADAGHPGYAEPPDAEQAAWDRWIAFNDGIAADPTLGAEGPDGGVVGEADLAAQEVAVAYPGYPASAMHPDHSAAASTTAGSIGATSASIRSISSSRATRTWSSSRSPQTSSLAALKHPPSSTWSSEVASSAVNPHSARS